MGRNAAPSALGALIENSGKDFLPSVIAWGQAAQARQAHRAGEDSQGSQGRQDGQDGQIRKVMRGR